MRQLINPPSWFDLNKYSDSVLFGFDAWRMQIGNRVALKGFLDARESAQFSSHFETIKKAPLSDIGFSVRFGSEHAVYPITFGVASSIVEALHPFSPSNGDSYDQKLRDSGQDAYAMHAHLTVDLNASRTEIVDSFEAWVDQALAENRMGYPREREPGMSEKVLEGWNRYRILPYQDLVLWHASNGYPMPSDTRMADCLFPEGNGDKDVVRETRRKAKLAFTLATVRQLSIAAAQ